MQLARINSIFSTIPFCALTACGCRCRSITSHAHGKQSEELNASALHTRTFSICCAVAGHWPLDGNTDCNQSQCAVHHTQPAKPCNHRSPLCGEYFINVRMHGMEMQMRATRRSEGARNAAYRFQLFEAFLAILCWNALRCRTHLDVGCQHGVLNRAYRAPGSIAWAARVAQPVESAFGAIDFLE